VIQTRHRIPETPLTERSDPRLSGADPEPLRFLEPREAETRKMHGLEEYGVMHVKLYEDIARHGASRRPMPIRCKVEGAM
jgi:alpha-D-ribose 1-methylphosphonate 5-phosphate C-P lyase